MLFWAGIFTGGLFIWLGVKAGFYETLVLLFNVVISIYVAIFLAPVIANLTGAKDTSFDSAFALASLAVGTFLVLFAVSYTFLTSQFKVAFPKIFETLFSGLLGFLTGFLVFSFAALVIAVAPLSRNRLVSRMGFTGNCCRPTSLTCAGGVSSLIWRHLRTGI